jgi:hypothetical protein
MNRWRCGFSSGGGGLRAGISLSRLQERSMNPPCDIDRIRAAITRIKRADQCVTKQPSSDHARIGNRQEIIEQQDRPIRRQWRVRQLRLVFPGPNKLIELHHRSREGVEFFGGVHIGRHLLNPFEHSYVNSIVPQKSVGGRKKVCAMKPHPIQPPHSHEQPTAYYAGECRGDDTSDHEFKHLGQGLPLYVARFLRLPPWSAPSSSFRETADPLCHPPKFLPTSGYKISQLVRWRQTQWQPIGTNQTEKTKATVRLPNSVSGLPFIV